MREETLSRTGIQGPCAVQMIRTHSSGISIRYLLRTYGSERAFHRVDEGSSHHTKKKRLLPPGVLDEATSKALLHRATSFLLTEPYVTTLKIYLGSNSVLHAPQVRDWFREIAFQLREIHRIGVAHSLIHADTIVLCEAAKQRTNPSRCFRDGPNLNPLVAKLSSLNCATVMDLTALRGLQKQTLALQRADPGESELHVLDTDLLPESIRQFFTKSPSLCPPEWILQLDRQGGDDAESTRSGGTSPRDSNYDEWTPKGDATKGQGLQRTVLLQSRVVPTAKSDAYLFGKVLQMAFTESTQELNPQIITSVMNAFVADSRIDTLRIPHQMGKWVAIDAINAESLRHLLLASTQESVDARWNMAQIFSHPFFWSPHIIAEYLSLLRLFAFPPGAQTGSSEDDASTTTDATGVSKITLRQAAKYAQRTVVNTKKYNITAAELSQLKNISRELSLWLVESRPWMTRVEDWIAAIQADVGGAGKTIRTAFDAALYQQLEFFLETFEYMLQHDLPGVCGGNAEAFCTEFFHRRFPWLLLESVYKISVADGLKFAEFIHDYSRGELHRHRHSSSARSDSVYRRRSVACRHVSPLSATHRETIECAFRKFGEEKETLFAAAGFTDAVTVTDGVPKFQVHCPGMQQLDEWGRRRRKSFKLS